MQNRLLVALFGIPLLLLVYIKGGIWLFLFVMLVSQIGLYEYYSMSENIGIKPYKKIGAVIMAIGIISKSRIIYYLKIGRFDYDYFHSQELGFLVFAFFTIGICSIFMGKTEGVNERIKTTFFGIAYLYMFSFAFDMAGLPYGLNWLLLVQVLVWLCDSFAYFTGITLGRKFFKTGMTQISPKKSKEGAIGGVVLTSAFLFLILKIASSFNVYLFDWVNMGFIKTSGGINYIVVIVFSLVITISSEIGDLLESLIKRGYNTKDSGKILGNHGGVLDRFDSLIFVIPIVFIFLSAFYTMRK